MYNNLLKFFAFILSYLAPVSTIAHVMMIFIAIDLISGCWASYKMKIPIISSKLRRTITKTVWYILALIMSHMMEVTFMPWSHMASIVGGFICMVELKSVFENITKITNEPVFMRIYKVFEKRAKEAVSIDNDNNYNNYNNNNNNNNYNNNQHSNTEGL